MLSIAVGPIVLSISQLITLVGLFMFWGITYLQTRNNAQQKQFLDYIFTAIIIGFLTARLTFIIAMWQGYQENWWQLVNISDGGFIPSTGWGASALVLMFYARRNKLFIKAYFTSALITFCCLIIPTFFAVIYQAAVELPSSPLRNIEGHEVDLRRYKGTPVVINFWASWCPPCRREMPVLEAAQKHNPELVFVFINQGESLLSVKDFIDSTALDLKNVFIDPTSNVSRETGAAGLPTTLFYNEKGQLVTSHMGELSQASLRYYLNQINSVVPLKKG
jgi:thiol-disulfide isomerase/thioredoxin